MAAEVGQDVVAMLAVSLDGYIADADGGVSFLDKYNEHDAGLDFDFEGWMGDVGGLITGSATYLQAVEFGWAFGDLPTTVLTSRAEVPVPEGADVRVLCRPTAAAIQSVSAETPGRLWVFGGAEVVMAGIEGSVIDRLDLMVMPEALGSGVPLLPRPSPRVMTLELVERYGSAVRLVYALDR